MPPRLLLDGEDLRTLMLRVREEAGPDARIVKAERIRSGGIAGFFAKEHYELTVEVPEVRPARRARPRPVRRTPAPAGIDALLDAADAADATGEQSGAPGAGGTTPGATTPGSGTPGSGTEVTLQQDQVPAVSTTGDAFASVLESVRTMVGPEWSEMTGAQQVDAVAEALAEAGAGAPEVDGSELAVVVGEETVADVLPAAATQAAPATSEPSDASPAAPDGSRGGASVTSLLELGVPARLLTGFADPTAPAPLSLLVRRFDKPPTVHHGPGVLVVAGPGDVALRTATQMAHRAGLQSHEIVLAGEIESVPGHGRRLQTAASAARLRARVVPDELTVVALGVPEDREGWDEAAQMLAAFEPDQAWAALDARRKPVDQRRWLRRVGAHRMFDALAAAWAFEAQAPGSVLSLGLPVGWVDGLPASPVVWAAVLSERLADDARWD